MLRCWACRSPFAEKAIRRDGLIRGRDPAHGGPYRQYRCPRCLKESKVEENGRHELFASPPKEMSLLDYLFGWIEPLAPEDFLHIAEWQGTHGDARRRFFERTGDRRYSGGLLRRLLAWLRRPRSARGERPSPTRRERGPRATPLLRQPRPRSVPHPYRILGVDPDADDEAVRKAFHDLARRWHPDKQRDPERVEEATRRWKELLRAFESIEKSRRA